MDQEHAFLKDAIELFRYYKLLGEKAMGQVDEAALQWQLHPGSNSICIIVQHLTGNMRSRWTDFLVSDGEKPWRNREAEFDAVPMPRSVMMEKWTEGWQILLSTMESLRPEDLSKTAYIRNMGQPVREIITRQLCHYAYHIGQIVLLCRMQVRDNWTSLSIPRGASELYNQEKFSRPPHIERFTDEKSS